MNPAHHRGLLAGAVLAAVLGGPAAAQELAVFERDNYVDPRLLGAVLIEDEAGGTRFEPGLRFLSLLALYGGISDYQQRGVFSQAEFGFIGASMQYYSGRTQLGISYTELDIDQSDFTERGLPGIELGPTGGVAPSRLRLNYGWYDLDVDQDPDKGEIDSARREAWLIIESPESGERTYELGAGVSIADELSRKLAGSLLLAWKIIDQQDDEYRISYLFEDQVWSSPKGPLVQVRWGYTAERTFSHWRWGSVRLESMLQVPIRPIRSNLHLAVAPSYRFRSQGVPADWNWELSFFVSTSALEILF